MQIYAQMSIHFHQTESKSSWHQTYAFFAGIFSFLYVFDMLVDGGISADALIVHFCD